jgi:hypothetical protein
MQRHGDDEGSDQQEDYEAHADLFHEDLPSVMAPTGLCIQRGCFPDGPDGSRRSLTASAKNSRCMTRMTDPDAREYRRQRA